ncbi:3-phosphoshikimate 1-carboxyvinyltransferase [Carboxydochorda subterranea]|uniref:3-phosphoshikimate 1-carboxyvinyltransferase n=1 Tax=Carboxydichorda subterranea TaxID=3109565 RepID=A0ABZ1C0T7_9FIRM|nr:3-phosphoshikimate 1-carboxyvinyltransferase [Limnochorda sp. L945t]WRP18559.1 3-phosphoshikimate 1-carboxyvinyltransferase [Limnochorda sp. L945t]
MATVKDQGSAAESGSRLIQVTPGQGVRGTAFVPPDKSLSHRAAMLGAIAEGTTVVRSFLTALDTLATLDCLRALGVEVAGPKDGTVIIKGRPGSSGAGAGFDEPDHVLDAGNSGTTLRLLAGLAAPHPIFWVATGDASLRRRPMGRVIEPLERMGARIMARRGGLAPLAITGGALSGIVWRTSVASAQVKSAILLAGLQARGLTRVEEPAQSRDHTERMLAFFGAELRRGEGWAELQGPQRLRGRTVTVPGDPSSAAFFWVAAAILPGSEVRTPEVGLNPTRIEVLRVLEEMGAEVDVRPAPERGPEPAGDVTVRGPSELRAVRIEGRRVPLLIDELPVLAVAALHARGTSQIRDAAELRYKESDRIDALAHELRQLGFSVETFPDGLGISGPQRALGGEAWSHGDHRLAMALVVAALAGKRPSVVKGTECIETSFPGFAAAMDRLARPGNARVVEQPA